MPARTAKEDLLLTGERLFARQGIEGASLRQISAEAGNTNNSAVHYYFGGKDKLVQAIIEHRLETLHARRRELIAESEPHDLRSWLACQIRTIMEQAEQPDSHYLAFLAELWPYGPRLMQAVPERYRDEIESFHARLRDMLPHLEEPVRGHRIRIGQLVMIQVAVQRERTRSAGVARPPLEVAITDLVDSMVGFFLAPASGEGAAASAGWDPATADLTFIV